VQASHDDNAVVSCAFDAPTARDPDVDRLADLLAGRRICVLAGAGVSTDSGIPDYRGPSTRHRSRSPVQYRDFMASASVRRRYWARAYLGWPRMASTRPNRAHEALAALEDAGRVLGIITQNVDRLHARAGSRHVIELHGALHEVVCLTCQRMEPRDALQARLSALNPDFAHLVVEDAPDGDAELNGSLIERFVVAPCEACGGPLKPHVVFFGENVPRPRVDAAWALWGGADALLVVGSSLTVFSGFRFVKKAPARALPVAIVNLGPTRGDALAACRVDRPLGEVLPPLAEALTGERLRSP
jgi:NAD-dependent SIR2 family protein deacetylase